ncbi:hypothetical protein, partial [Streptomyces sp. NPDC003487]
MSLSGWAHHTGGAWKRAGHGADSGRGPGSGACLSRPRGTYLKQEIPPAAWRPAPPCPAGCRPQAAQHPWGPDWLAELERTRYD